MLASLRFLLLSLWLGTLAGAGAHAAATVVVVISDASAAYLEATGALTGELVHAGVPRADILQLTVAELAAAKALGPKLYIALGADAANALAKTESRVPVLCTLLPRSSFERVLELNGRKASSMFSALYLDQPISRQLALIRSALPTALRMAVLWGPESQADAAALRSLAQLHGLELTEARIDRPDMLFSALKGVMEEADLLLAMPDSSVYNSNTIQNILLASLRAKVPVVAFSPAYVRAGALFALHATPTQIGLQAAGLAHAVLQGKALPAKALYSYDFEVSVNQHVARSLGFTLDADRLRNQLRLQESAP